MNPYQRSKEKSKNDLIMEHLPLIKKVAYKLVSRLPAGIEVEDLIQTGILGLIDAIDRFEHGRDVTLKTFAEFRIRGAMLDELRNKDWIPRSVRENSTKLEQAYKKLRGQGIDHPSDKQLAHELGIPTDDFSDFLNKSRAIPLLSMDEPASDEAGESQSFSETIRDVEGISQLDSLVDEENKEKLVEGIKKLDEREQMILSLYYQEDLNLKEIAEVLGLTESRISQLRTKAIARLRSFLND